MIPYNIIAAPCQGEYEEKKSKFIAYLAPIESEEEAQAFINSIKKKHYDARHNCSAFIIGPNKDIVRSSDDGEPSGTAGRPMLEVLNGSSITNIVAVVTRYFGGVLLGTGGLVRAYTEAVKDALTNATICKITYCSDITIETTYQEVNNIQYYIGNNNIMLLDTSYTDKVIFTIRVDQTIETHTVSALSELTKGKASINIKDRGWNPNTH